MEALLFEAFMIQCRTTVKTFKELEPFLNIDEQSGFFYYRIIVMLKTLFVLYALETAIPKTWALASIIIGKFYVAYMDPIMIHAACIGSILHVLGLFTPQMTMMGMISMDYKSYEFLLDIYVVLCSLYYAVQVYRGEIKKLTMIFMGLAIGSCVNDATPLPSNLYTYCAIIVLYVFTIFILLPNRPEYSHGLMCLYTVLYLCILFKMGQHYDTSQSSASQTINSSDQCMIPKHNFKPEQCGLIEALENQEEMNFAKSLNMSDCVDYDTQKPLDTQMKNLLKKTVFKNTADVKQEEAAGEYEVYPNATCASVDIKPDGGERKNSEADIQKEVIDDATPTNEELIETAKKENKKSELIEKNGKHIIFGTEERNDIIKQDYTELRQEPFIQDFIHMNEDSMKERPSENIKVTETTEDTYSTNGQSDISERFLVKESSVEDVNEAIEKRLGNVKTPKGDQLSTGTNQENNLVCKVRENNSANFDEDLINYSSFISKQDRGRKENENELEAIDVCDAAGIELEEFETQDIDAGKRQEFASKMLEDVHSVDHYEIQATVDEALLADEREDFDVNESEGILSKTFANDYPTEAGDAGVKKPSLTVAVGTEETKPTAILVGELESEGPEAFEANKVAVIEASESETLSEALPADNPINADDPVARELELNKASDLGKSKLEPTTARHPGANERDPSNVDNIESIQTQEIKARKPEANETDLLEPNKGKAIYVSEADVILSKTLFADHPNEASEGVMTQAGKREVLASQATEAGDTGAYEFQATKSKKANAIEPQASEVGNDGETEPTAAQTNEARASETVEAEATEADKVYDTEPKPIQAREAEPSKTSAAGPNELETTKATDPSATQLQAIKANEGSATVPQSSESADTEGIEPQATQADESGATEACKTGTTEDDKAKPAKISELGASELETSKTSCLGATEHESTKTGKAQKKETKVYVDHRGKATDAIEANSLSADHPSETGEREAALSQASNAGETEATEIQATKSNEANAIQPQAGEIGSIGKTEPKAAQSNAGKASETGEARTIEAGEAEATDHKTSQDREAEHAKASDPRPIKLEPTETDDPRTTKPLATQSIEGNATKSQAAQAKEAEASEAGTTEVGNAETTEPRATQSRKAEPAKSSDPGATELQAANSKEDGATVHQGSEAGGTGATELQTAQADEGGAIEASETEPEPAKGNNPGASELEPTKTDEAEKEETEIYEAHKGKAIVASEAEEILYKALSDDHQSKADEREAAASQATDTGDTGATELQAPKPKEANAIESQASEVSNIGETKPKVVQANETRASETSETGTIDAGELEATDPQTCQARETEPAKASDPRPIKLQHTEANDPRTTESPATKAIEANAIKPQTAQTKEAEASEAGKTEVGEADTTEPKATQTREAEPAKSSDRSATELQATESNVAGATVSQGNETGDNGTVELQAAQVEEGEAGKTETGEAEPVKGSDPGASELEPTKDNDPGASEPELAHTGEDEKEETGVYEAHKSESVDVSESNAIFKAIEGITALAAESQAAETCENGTSQTGETAATESKVIEAGEGGATGAGNTGETGLEEFVPLEGKNISTTEFETVSLSIEAGKPVATKFEAKAFENNSKYVKELSFHSLVSVNEDLIKSKDGETEI